MPRGKPICHFCQHFDSRRFDRDSHYRCSAFPNVIPASIQDSRYDHRQPYPGDGGIQFAKYTDLSQLPAYLQQTPEIRRHESYENSLNTLKKNPLPKYIQWLIDSLMRWLWLVAGKLLRRR